MDYEGLSRNDLLHQYVTLFFFQTCALGIDHHFLFLSFPLSSFFPFSSASSRLQARDETIQTLKAKVERFGIGPSTRRSFFAIGEGQLDALSLSVSLF